MGGMADPKPPIAVQLTWDRDQRFSGSSGSVSMALDGRAADAPSPMQAVAFGLAGCMAIDVVEILTKGRHPLQALDVTLVGERASQPPRRFTRMTLHYLIRGDVPEAAVGRAIQLSQDKYCSVWHSLRQDITLTVTHAVHP